MPIPSGHRAAQEQGYLNVDVQAGFAQPHDALSRLRAFMDCQSANITPVSDVGSRSPVWYGIKLNRVGRSGIGVKWTGLFLASRCFSSGRSV
jgi:hypothetical protein